MSEMSQVDVNYMSNIQTDINRKMRSILIDWLMDVSIHFKCETPIIMPLTISIMDRYLSRVAINRNILQLVGCVSMHLATLFHELFSTEVRDFIYISDNAFTKSEFLCKEREVLEILQFNVLPNRDFHQVYKWIMDHFKAYCSKSPNLASETKLRDLAKQKTLPKPIFIFILQFCYLEMAQFSYQTLIDLADYLATKDQKYINSDTSTALATLVHEIQVHRIKFNEKRQEHFNNLQSEIEQEHQDFIDKYTSLPGEVTKIIEKPGQVKFPLSVGSFIGMGTYGSVYKAQSNDETKKWYAVKIHKVIDPLNTNDDDNYYNSKLVYTLREIALLSACDHPNIVKYYGSYLVDNKIHMVMELGKCTLQDLSTDDLNGNLNTDLILKQLTNAVRYLHSMAFLHRDLRPDNVIVTDDNTVKLCDFGCCRIKTVCMTPTINSVYYRAPEVMYEDRTDYDESVDIWALGCLYFNIKTDKQFLFDEHPIDSNSVVKQNLDDFSLDEKDVKLISDMTCFESDARILPRFDDSD